MITFADVGIIIVDVSWRFPRWPPSDGFSTSASLVLISRQHFAIDKTDKMFDALVVQTRVLRKFK